MTDIPDLMQQHGAPLPKAMVLETEVRTEGALAFQTLNVPSWVNATQTSSAMGEWRCDMTHEQIEQLQITIKTVNTNSGKSCEQVLNETFQALDIGSFLGVFIESGDLIDGAGTVRFLFAYRSKTMGTIELINRKIHELITNPATYPEGAGILLDLRQKWREGTNKWEGGLMLLSELNLYNPEQFPYTGAKLGRP